MPGETDERVFVEQLLPEALLIAVITVIFLVVKFGNPGVSSEEAYVFSRAIHESGPHNEEGHSLPVVAYAGLDLEIKMISLAFIEG